MQQDPSSGFGWIVGLGLLLGVGVILGWLQLDTGTSHADTLAPAVDQPPARSENQASSASEIAAQLMPVDPVLGALDALGDALPVAARFRTSGRLRDSLTRTDLDLLANVRRDTLRCTSRLPDRLLIEGLAAPARPGSAPRAVRLRVVLVDGQWRLEHVRTLPPSRRQD